MSIFSKRESLPLEQPVKKEEVVVLDEAKKQKVEQKIAEIDQRAEEIKQIRTNEEDWNNLDNEEAQKLFDEYTEINLEREKLQRILEGKPDTIFIDHSGAIWDKETRIIKNILFHEGTFTKVVRTGTKRSRHYSKDGYITECGGKLIIYEGNEALDTNKRYNVKVIKEEFERAYVEIIESL